MHLALESTAILTTVQGVDCRVWDGITAGGIPCRAFVVLLAVALGDFPAFDAELRIQLQPAERRPLADVLLGSG